MKPLIGITRCSKLEDYVASIEQSGGRAALFEQRLDDLLVLADQRALLASFVAAAEQVQPSTAQALATCKDPQGGQRHRPHGDLARDAGVRVLACQ